MTADEAEDLAARTLAAIRGALPETANVHYTPREQADRERVASDLAGLRQCAADQGGFMLRMTPHARRYADGLTRTARLYGVTP